MNDELKWAEGSELLDDSVTIDEVVLALESVNPHGCTCEGCLKDQAAALRMARKLRKVFKCEIPR